MFQLFELVSLRGDLHVLGTVVIFEDLIGVQVGIGFVHLLYLVDVLSN